MVFNNPIGSEKADRLVQLLELRPGGRALDVGCGTGEFLLRVVAHHDVHGVGLDRDSKSIAAAREGATARGLAGRCDFQEVDANDFRADPGTFDLGICIGSTHAFGMGDVAYPNTIDRMIELVRPGGYVLVGEGYWKQEPAAEYLQMIGDPVGIYRDHAGNVTFAQKRGLTPLYATVSNEEEWDHFEWCHKMKVEREAWANPDDASLAARLARSGPWIDGYLRWGRSTMGFGLYLFRTG
ncbi:MAG: SAM-dependent methyltransferase [bacterium]